MPDLLAVVDQLSAAIEEVGDEERTGSRFIGQEAEPGLVEQLAAGGKIRTARKQAIASRTARRSSVILRPRSRSSRSRGRQTG
jgi:hypothetical protein